MKPVIAITADCTDLKYKLGKSYARMVQAAGGVPIILPCQVEDIPAYLELCDGFVFSGGDDLNMSHWGKPMHPKATPLHPERQAFEVALMKALDAAPAKPVLGVCLGMQLMGVHNGGELNQHLADSLPTAAEHWDRRSHTITGELGQGVVHSHHRQALSDAGSLQVIARAPDGVIEAIKSTQRPFYVGVQWHPERTADRTLGQGVFAALVQAASR